MGKVCRLEINGNAISARRGDLLLDAALLNGIEIPYDCRSGLCGTCRVRVLDGRVFGGKADAETVYACQSRIVSDLRIDVEDVPETVTLPGVVADLTPLAADTCEVCIEVPEWPEYIPGQYYSVQFRGFPARYFSPTAPLDWPYDETLMRFHVTRLPNGRVSSALGKRIRAGHRVQARGSVRFGLPEALSWSAPCIGSKRKWLCANLVDRRGGDKNGATTGNRAHCLLAQGRVIVHGPGALPIGPVSQCHDHTRGFRGPGCHRGGSRRQADRSPSRLDAA